MTSNIYPKLHLPPDFYEEIGVDTLEMKRWFGAAFVELEDGTFVRPEFIVLWRVESEANDSGYYYPQDTIILAEFILNRIKEILPKLAKFGAFDPMTRYSSLKWNE